jgi:hypothetical protein
LKDDLAGPFSLSVPMLVPSITTYIILPTIPVFKRKVDAVIVDAFKIINIDKQQANILAVVLKHPFYPFNEGFSVIGSG